MTEELKDNVKTDKRKQTSGKNLAKAREAKLNKLKQEKKEKVQQYQFEDSESSSSSSDSEDERIIVKKEKRKTKKVKQNTNQNTNQNVNELTEIKGMLEQLLFKKPKRSKPKKSKQVVQVITPPAQEPKKVSPEMESLKKQFLLKF